MDLRVSFAEIAEDFGAAAVVTRPHPDNVPIATSVVWQPPRESLDPGGLSIGRQEPLRVLLISYDDVPSVPLNTLVEVADGEGRPVKRWKVVGTEEVHDDHVRVRVVLAPRSRTEE